MSYSVIDGLVSVVLEKYETRDHGEHRNAREWRNLWAERAQGTEAVIRGLVGKVAAFKILAAFGRPSKAAKCAYCINPLVPELFHDAPSK